MPDFKDIQELEKRLWAAADNLRANSGLTTQEYSRLVLDNWSVPYCLRNFIALRLSLGQNEVMNPSRYLLRLEFGLQASELQ